jgi:ABC-2 type transport system permease protein
MRLYWEVARRALQRQLAYATANLAGLVTNVFFGYLRAAVLLAFYGGGQSSIAGYDASAAVSYAWITQAMIMVVALWGWWEVEETIRTGDVVSDLSKPFSYVGFWLARDAGRAVYFVVFRCAPILLAGQVLFGLRWPPTPLAWLAFLLSLAMAVVVSFGWRFLLNVSAFWTTDARGVGWLALAASLFLGGFAIPLRFFPDWLQPIVLALPFAAMTQVPSDLFVGRLSGSVALVGLAQQAVWVVVMLALAHALTGLATRRVVTQGG